MDYCTFCARSIGGVACRSALDAIECNIPGPTEHLDHELLEGAHTDENSSKSPTPSKRGGIVRKAKATRNRAGT